jgi:hypothetical protein
MVQAVIENTRRSQRESVPIHECQNVLCARTPLRQPVPQPHRPRFVFSPALVQYFAEVQRETASR